MYKSVIFIFISMIFIFPGFTTSYAQQDVKGSEDHPMISRYEGAYIRGYEHYNYDRMIFYTKVDGELEEIVPEGEVTRILYFLPEGLSVLQVQRNYQIALKEAGFEIIYECFGGMDAIPRTIFRDFERIGGRKNRNVFNGKDAGYFMARLSKDNGDVFVSVRTILSDYADANHQPVSAVEILQEKPMATGKVKVEINAEAMAEDIDEKKVFAFMESASIQIKQQSKKNPNLF